MSAEAVELATKMFYRDGNGSATTLDKELNRIRRLTAIDMAHKTFNQLTASAIEEIGELARELKIDKKVFGNTYKQLDEGPKAEAVDVFVVSAACFYAEDGMSFDSIHYYETSDDVFEQLALLASQFSAAYRNPANKSLRLFYYHSAAQIAVYIFVKCGGTEEEFLKILSKKVSKWERNQS